MSGSSFCMVNLYVTFDVLCMMILWVYCLALQPLGVSGQICRLLLQISKAHLLVAHSFGPC